MFFLLRIRAASRCDCNILLLWGGDLIEAACGFSLLYFSPVLSDIPCCDCNNAATSLICLYTHAFGLFEDEHCIIDRGMGKE